jgi:hypothetical protein
MASLLNPECTMLMKDSGEIEQHILQAQAIVAHAAGHGSCGIPCLIFSAMLREAAGRKT